MSEGMHIIRGWRHDPFAPECGCRLLPCPFVEPKADCEQHGLRSGKTIRGMHLASECPAKEGELMDIEEEIARALAEWRSGEHAEPWEVDMYGDAATALMPLVKRAQAEVEAAILAKVAENAEELQHTREEVRERIYDGYSVDWSGGYDAACGDIAKWARRLIENEGERA